MPKGNVQPNLYVPTHHTNLTRKRNMSCFVTNIRILRIMRTCLCDIKRNISEIRAYPPFRKKSSYLFMQTARFLPVKILYQMNKLLLNPTLLKTRIVASTCYNKSSFMENCSTFSSTQAAVIS